MSETSNYYKEINGLEESRELILKAIDLLATPVKRTLGPEGLPILLQIENAPPLNTKDGVTVADSISVESQSINTIIHSIKESARKTNEQAGDGTTTAIVLTEALIKEGLKLIKMDAIKPQEVVSQIQEATKLIVEELGSISEPVKTKEQQKHVALISSNNDEEVANCVVEAIDRAGQDGFVKIDDGISAFLEVHHLDGYKLDTGFHKFGTLGTTFITHPEKHSSILEAPKMIFYNGNLSDVNDFASFLIEYTGKGEKWPPSMVIVANEFSGSLINFVVANRQRGAPMFLLKTPVLGSPNSSRPLILKDLAVYCGGEVVDGLPQAFQKILSEEGQTENIFGSCDKLILEQYQSTIYNGHGTDEDKEKYIDVLKAQVKGAESEWDADFVRTRIGKITGGVVSINVGGRTKLEADEKKARVEDSYNATRAAIEEGILPGGGCALLYVSRFLDGNSFVQKMFQDILQYPIAQILNNAGLSCDVILEKIKTKNKDGIGFGYDVKQKQYVKNMLEYGIVDPLKVVRCALINASSIACQMLICGGVVSHDKTAQKRDIATL